MSLAEWWKEREIVDVTLTAQQEESVRRQLDGGKFVSANEVEAEGVSLLDDLAESEQRRLEALQSDILRAAGQADRGETVEADAVFSRLKARIAGVGPAPSKP
jgi:Arc/MetJ-type ribon-helix-helix transcriptional regulator